MAEIIAKNIKQLRVEIRSTPIPTDEKGTLRDVKPELHDTTTSAETNKNPVSDTFPTGIYTHQERQEGKRDSQ